ncbi:MAG: DUF86 domain-containing protein [Anaerolineae bacterium]|nr:DUF86 domain-containing protein [Anaerolineae bacterium]
MTRHSLIIRLRHMLDHAREAFELTKGRSRADLDSDPLLNLALVRLLEVIGEAANSIPKEEQVNYPEISWAQIVALRNRLIHAMTQLTLIFSGKLSPKIYPLLLQL